MHHYNVADIVGGRESDWNETYEVRPEPQDHDSSDRTATK